MTWAPDYCTVPDVKGYLRISDTADDVLLGLWVTAASRAVDKNCGRQFGQVATSEDRVYEAHFDSHIGCWVVEVDDLYGSTITVTGPDSHAITDFEFGPVNALVKGKVYERLLLTRPVSAAFPGGWWGWPYATVVQSNRQRVKVTVSSAQWGWPSVPPAVKVATMLQAARLSARRDAPFGVAGSPADGSEVRLFAQLDPDLVTSLAAFKRNWWAA